MLLVSSKSSVSKLVGSADSDDYLFTSKPSFCCEGGMSATKRGTATHKVMQFLDLSNSLLDLNEEIERLAEELEIRQAPTLVCIENGIATKYAGVSNIKKYLKV